MPNPPPRPTVPDDRARRGPEAFPLPQFPWRRLFPFLHGVVLGVILPAASLTVWGGFSETILLKHAPDLVVSAVGFVICLSISAGWVVFYNPNEFVILGLTVTCIFLLLMGVMFLFGVTHSRFFLVIVGGLTFAWIVVFRWLERSRREKFALIPGDLTAKLASQTDGPQWIRIQGPSLEEPVDGIVVDFRADLSREWSDFISDCSVRGIPVYNAASLFEFYTGRIDLDHLTEELVEDFKLPELYLGFRRVLEMLLIFVTLPVTLPLLGLVAAVVRLESSGPILFWQTRVGRGGDFFQMVKFRTMKPNSAAGGAKFASEESQRVTSVGNFLRRYRLDELPQLWNVLKGEMSLIGPRPEQVPFAEEFHERVPFYRYRHLIRPGITGWAQVHQGYLTGGEGTQQKLEYDLFYLKHVSWLLDLLICYLTARVLVPGLESH